LKKIALLLLCSPLLLAACGSSSHAQVTADPIAYVKHAGKKTAGLPSEHMTMTATISVGGLKGTMTGSGDFANATRQGQMDVVAGAAGRDTTHVREVISGTTIYLRSPVYDAQLPKGKTWMKLDLQKAGASAHINYSSLLMSQSPPRGLLQLEAAGSVKSIGVETIDRVETTHYQVTNLDITKLPQGAKIQALAHPKYGPIDVWIGNKDGYVYRESLSFTYSAAGQSGSMAMRVDLSNFGEKVDVNVPPANTVFDASSLIR
jgi:hypothetical protein